MIIVVEGPDNCGKTTIALRLAKRLKAIYLKTENIPPERQYLWQYQNTLDSATRYGNGIVITDRHHAVSDLIYGPIVRGYTKLDAREVDSIMQYLDVFVYCRPNDEAITRTMGERDQMAGVINNIRHLIDAYDNYFAQLRGKKPIYRWDYTKDNEEILSRELLDQHARFS